MHLAHADHRQLPVEATDRRATAARQALVAWLVGVVEIRATRTLQQIACGGGAVAQLPRRTCQQRTRQHGVIATHAGIGCQIGIAHQGADAQATIRCLFDGIQAQPVDIDQMRGRLDLQFHQIEQVCAASDEIGTRLARRLGRSVGGRGRTLVAKRLHARSPATSLIASMMLNTHRSGRCCRSCAPAIPAW